MHDRLSRSDAEGQTSALSANEARKNTGQRYSRCTETRPTILCSHQKKEKDQENFQAFNCIVHQLFLVISRKYKV